MSDEKKQAQEQDTKQEPHRVRLPGFTSQEDVGVGDVIKRVTSALGVKPCGGCKRRAQRLNRRLVFSGLRRK